jgi:large repetitive protein
VTGTNDAPVAQNDEFATNENTAVNGNVLADNGNGPDDDVDGDPLTVTHVNGSTANVGTQIVLASGALLLLNADGSFAYDPNGQFDELGPGDSAQDSFTYTVADGQGGSDTATVTLTINGVNEAPVATTA